MMKRIYTLIIGVLMFLAPADAQKRVVDAVTQSPVAAVPIFDAAGNMVGVTWSDGLFSEVPESAFPSLLKVFDLNDDEVTAPESFKESGNTVKHYEEAGKSGMALIQKQNAQTFIVIEDVLAETKEYKLSPWPLKLLGFTMEFNQFYTTHAYRANDKGVYLSKDLIEASFVMEADGRGKHLRKAIKSDKPVVIRSLIELYIVDRDYLSKDEAKEECKNKPADVKFVIPSTVPPLNETTCRLVERANAEINKQ